MGSILRKGQRPFERLLQPFGVDLRGASVPKLSINTHFDLRADRVILKGSDRPLIPRSAVHEMFGLESDRPPLRT